MWITAFIAQQSLLERKRILTVDFPLCVCRLVTNKLLLAIIILMELAILGAVVYLKFIRWATASLLRMWGQTRLCSSVSPDCPILITFLAVFSKFLDVDWGGSFSDCTSPLSGEAEVLLIRNCVLAHWIGKGNGLLVLGLTVNWDLHSFF